MHRGRGQRHGQRRVRRAAHITAAVVAIAALSLTPATAAPQQAPGPPQQLTVDDLTHPLGVGLTDVFFAWEVNDARRGAVQGGYRILVSSDDPTGRHRSETVWDSGEVRSAQQAFIPYGGPPLEPDATYRWTVQTWSGSGGPGPLAPPATFETGLRTADWTADWIRRATPNPVDASSSTSATESDTGIWLNQDEYTYARKEVVLDHSPIVRARAYISADQQYELYVNGTMAAKGGTFDYPDSQPYETDDITSLLRPGTGNVLGLLYNWQGPGKGRPEGSPGVIAQISILHADGTREVVGTDGMWKVLPGAWLPGAQRNQQGDPVDYTENINGPAEPVGWDLPGYDDLEWATPIVVGRPPVAPWTDLVPARTRIAYTPVSARSITVLPSGAVVADFGQVIAAIPTVTFRQGVAGRQVTMHAGYELDGAPPTTVSTTKGTQGTDMSYSYVERGGGAETFRPFDYLGFRYLQIDDPGEMLRAGDVVALARHAAMPQPAATFSSTNPTADAVYQLAAHSALYTAQEEMIDTPTREKGPFLRDGFNESQTDMAAFGDQNLTRHELLAFARSQTRYWPDGRLNAIYPSGEYPYVRDIPDFTEIYPDWVWQYWLRTGDRALLAAVYPVTVAVAAYVARSINPGTGLVTSLSGGGSSYAGGLVDWPPSGRYGYDMNTAARTTVNELAVDMFERVAGIAQALGRPGGEVAVQRGRAARLSAAINARLRRPDGVYIDGLEPNGAPSTHASQHANAYAIAYGVVPPTDSAPVAAYAATLGMAMGPQTAQELLAAMRLSGRPGDLVRRITDASSDGWAKILALGGTFTWEDWNPSDADGDSMSHGWGSTVLVEIQAGLLGVSPTGPGFSSFTVAPPLSGLNGASGVVPTPRGPVSVSWSRPASTAGVFALSITVPAGAEAAVQIPAVRSSDVRDSGRPVSGDPGVRVVGMQGPTLELTVGAGTYRFASSPVPTSASGRATLLGGAAGGSEADGANGADGATGAAPGGTAGSRPAVGSGGGIAGGSKAALPVAHHTGGGPDVGWWVLAAVLAGLVVVGAVATAAVAGRRRSRRPAA